jgi:hypothetical protein
MPYYHPINKMIEKCKYYCILFRITNNLIVIVQFFPVFFVVSKLPGSKAIFYYTNPFAMRNLLLFTFCVLNVKNLTAQVPTAMPPDANAFYINAMPVIRQQVKDIILQTASAIKHYTANADSLSLRLRTNKTLKGMSNNDIEGITVLIMVKASNDTDADLKLIVLGMSRRNEQKQQQGSGMQTVSANNIGNKTRSIEEINDMQNLKLQVIMERKRRMAEEISNVMKNISGTQQNIINDLK